MANPIFTLGGDSISFSSNITFPGRRSQERLQATDRTAGGTLIVEDLGSTVSRRTLYFNDLSAADMASLITWHDTISNGAANSFTYTDEDGSSMTVRLLTNPLSFEEFFTDHYRGSLVLEVVS